MVSTFLRKHIPYSSQSKFDEVAAVYLEALMELQKSFFKTTRRVPDENFDRDHSCATTLMCRNEQLKAKHTNADRIGIFIHMIFGWSHSFHSGLREKCVWLEIWPVSISLEFRYVFQWVGPFLVWRTIFLSCYLAHINLKKKKMKYIRTRFI